MLVHGWKTGDWFSRCCILEVFLTANLVRSDGADEGRHMVGQRLAGMDHSRIALGADEEESPLQSKRSSRFSFFRLYGNFRCHS